VERWRDLVAAYFPASEVDTALAVMACESGGDPNAYNPSGASGLMQVLASWADNFGVLPDQLFDPETNIWIASELWADGGWTHWACA
jgi:soluble lytic murein transglycosylase-like protein